MPTQVVHRCHFNKTISVSRVLFCYPFCTLNSKWELTAGTKALSKELRKCQTALTKGLV